MEVIIKDEMIELADKIESDIVAGKLASVEVATGIAQNTLRNIHKAPTEPRRKSTLKVLFSHYKIKVKK